MSFPKRSVAAPCLCIKSGIIWTCDWCIPVVPHPNNRTCTHYTGDRRASNVRFCLGASGRKADTQNGLTNVWNERRRATTQPANICSVVVPYANSSTAAL